MPDSAAGHLDRPAHLGWLLEQERSLLDFGRRVVRPDHLAHWLAADGTADMAKPTHIYIAARMAYVYSLGSMRGIPGCPPFAIS